MSEASDARRSAHFLSACPVRCAFITIIERAAMKIAFCVALATVLVTFVDSSNTRSGDVIVIAGFGGNGGEERGGGGDGDGDGFDLT